MKFIQTAPTGGDETAPFVVLDYQAKTPAEFVNEVLKNNREWGSFTVKRERGEFNAKQFVLDFWDRTYAEYAQGKLKSEMPASWHELKIERICASGGWSNMDYCIYTKEEKED